MSKVKSRVSRHFLYGFSDHSHKLKNALKGSLEALDTCLTDNAGLFQVIGPIFAVGFTHNEWQKVCMNVEKSILRSFTHLYTNWHIIVNYSNSKFQEFVRLHDPGDIDSLVLLLITCGLTGDLSLSRWAKNLEETLNLGNTDYPVKVLRELILSIFQSLESLEDHLEGCTLEDTPSSL
jgi:hypothetical protein